MEHVTWDEIPFADMNEHSRHKIGCDGKLMSGSAKLSGATAAGR